MSDYQQSVNQQYGQADLRTKVLTALQNAGKNVDALTRADLSTFDEFHIGGIAETRSLAAMAGLQPAMHILDVGSGLGGPARTLAAEFDCRVTGIDLTEAFCQTAEMLTERVGLSDRVQFRQGNALDMPFDDASFDVVWTQFAAMNIGEKSRLYDEMKRVLRPGGKLVLYEVMAGAQGDLNFPVFWANDPSLSFLRPPDEIRALLAEKGFNKLVWNDLTAQASEWYKAIIARAQQDGPPPPLSFNVFIVDSVPQKAANVLRNLEENRIVVVQGIYENE